jgi:hypothetical protein
MIGVIALSPPVEFDVDAVIPPLQAIRAVVALEHARGHVGGRVTDATPEDRAAEDRLFRAHTLRVKITHIAFDGTPTFEIAREGA